MDKSEARKIWEQVQENHKKLDGCLCHDFSLDITPHKNLGKTWQCTNCGGTVDSMAKLWYENGLKHGS